VDRTPHSTTAFAIPAGTWRCFEFPHPHDAEILVNLGRYGRRLNGVGTSPQTRHFIFNEYEYIEMKTALYMAAMAFSPHSPSTFVSILVVP